MDSLQPFLENYAYIAVFLGLLACGLGVPIPEEVFLIGAGLAVHKYSFDFTLMTTIAMTSIMIGDSLAFFAGKYWAHKLYRFPLLKKLLGGDEAKQSRIQQHFADHSFKTIFIGRFVAGLRAPTFFFAGGHGVSYWRFFFADLLGALVSVPISIWLAWKFGANIEEARRMIGNLHMGILILIGTVLLGVFIWWFLRRRRKQQQEAAQQDIS